MKLSDTQGLILGQASRHEQGLAAAPKTLPAAARNAVFRSMLKNGLLAECAAPRGCLGLAWRGDADGARVALRITGAGLRAIGIDPREEGGAAAGSRQDESTDAPEAEAPETGQPSGADRAPSPPRPAPRRPREGTKRETVLAMLRRPGGATVAQIAEATGWAPHTVRGFFAGLKKRGVEVAVLGGCASSAPTRPAARAATPSTAPPGRAECAGDGAGRAGSGVACGCVLLRPHSRQLGCAEQQDAPGIQDLRCLVLQCRPTRLHRVERGVQRVEAFLLRPGAAGAPAQVNGALYAHRSSSSRTCLRGRRRWAS